MLSNSVTLIGNLGSDIEMRETTGSQTLGRVNIAVTKSYKDRNGDMVKDTQWFKLIAWAQIAERMNSQLKKGSRVLIEGRLSCRNYETKDGQKRQSVEVSVSNFTLLGRSETKPSGKVTLIESGVEAAPAF